MWSKRQLRWHILDLMGRKKTFQQGDIVSACEEHGYSPTEIKTILRHLYREGMTRKILTKRGEDAKYELEDYSKENLNLSSVQTLEYRPLLVCAAELAAWISKGYGIDPNFRKLVSAELFPPARKYLKGKSEFIPTIEYSIDFYPEMKTLVGRDLIYRVEWSGAALRLMGKTQGRHTRSLFYPSDYKDWECVKLWDVIPDCPHRSTQPDAFDFGKPKIPSEEGAEGD